MPTLADVAALAAVSKATASRALSREELVAPETAARVRAAAEQLGFVPNRAARHLARGRTGIIALVVPTLDNSFFTPIIDGAQSRAGEADLQLTVSVHSLDSPAATGAFTRLASQVDGFIVVAPRGPDDGVRAAGSLKPAVLVDREIEGMTSVVADTATAFGFLVSRLVDDGHDRIVYVGGPAGSWQDGQRSAAVAAAASGRAELTVLGPHPSTFAAGVAIASAVRESGATAVVPYATAIGLGLMFALAAEPAGRPVTVSSERMVVESLAMRGVPAIDVDGAELGRKAADLLLARLAAGPRTPLPAERLRLPVPVRWPDLTEPLDA
ncbi:LacI family DNA-binding transcriptional regulator [Nocardiopsis sp. CT-R113]|uniref:LacI family DNA-binding transcriptional regulator n=1 Tax=Nocardiopsis codii TaxID=3065942 RepID=A0ABU7KFY0_9ACTN|nr:LacI family DNA-binding transcriptional regulator [Nocardiopsis sp. CT-R113]MEE2041146.1 LacI family DNA-binding transcriptional regulator [Nocardiopsis sp. CT-R113]